MLLNFRISNKRSGELQLISNTEQKRDGTAELFVFAFTPKEEGALKESAF